MKLSKIGKILIFKWGIDLIFAYFFFVGGGVHVLILILDGLLTVAVSLREVPVLL